MGYQKRAMNFDEVLNYIGEFGKFQKTLYVWICLPYIQMAFHMLVSVFIGAVPPLDCRSAAAPPVYNPNFILVGGSRKAFSCGGPALTWVLNDSLLPVKGDAPGGCPGGWDFSKDTFKSAVVTERELECHNAMLNNVGSSIYMFGLFIGAILFGALADKYGRRNIILVGLSLQVIFGVGAAFAPDFYVYTLLRFAVGTTIPAVTMSSFVLGTEWTRQKEHMLAVLLSDYLFWLGYLLLAGLAYLIRDWRKLQLAISAPGVLFFFYIWVLPKSARWLLANERNIEAMDVIRKAAAVNGKPLSADITLCENNKDLQIKVQKNKYTAADLFRTPKMRRNSLIMSYLWFVSVLVYYGLSLNVSDFGTNIYLALTIFGLAEIPARTIILLRINCSRKFCLSFFSLIGGLACMFTSFIPDEFALFRTVLVMLGKFGISGSQTILRVYVAEIFPTIIRQSGVGMSTMCARAGGVIAPLLPLSSSFSKEAFMVVFGLCTVLGAALTMLLPETANQPLPDTIQDVEDGLPVDSVLSYGSFFPKKAVK